MKKICCIIFWEIFLAYSDVSASSETFQAPRTQTLQGSIHLANPQQQSQLPIHKPQAHILFHDDGRSPPPQQSPAPLSTPDMQQLLCPNLLPKGSVHFSEQQKIKGELEEHKTILEMLSMQYEEASKELASIEQQIFQKSQETDLLKKDNEQNKKEYERILRILEERKKRVEESSNLLAQSEEELSQLKRQLEIYISQQEQINQQYNETIAEADELTRILATFH